LSNANIDVYISLYIYIDIYIFQTDRKRSIAEKYQIKKDKGKLVEEI